MIYELHLINNDESLDLTQKEGEINQVIDFILNGGSTGDAYEYVSKIFIESIHRDKIVLDVEAENNHWHGAFGQRLVQEFGMRDYCDPNNSNRMFEWFEVKD